MLSYRLLTIYIPAILVFASQKVNAQEDWSESGEIQDAQVVIEKDRNITLPEASRRFEKIPPTQIGSSEETQLYDFGEFPYQGEGYDPSLKAQKLERFGSVESLQHYLKLGYGNFRSPLGELSLNTSNDILAGGVRFSHLSFGKGAVSGSKSAASDNIVNLYGIRTGDNNRFSVDLDFNSVKRYHYGFSSTPIPDNVTPDKQRYDTYGARLGLADTDDANSIDYDIKAGIYSLKDKFDASEIAFQSEMDLRALVSEELAIFSNFQALISDYEDGTSINRNLLRITGGVGYQLGQLRLTGAARFVINNDTISNSKNFRIYPHAAAQYQISPKWMIEGGLDGNVDPVTLRSLTRENPFLAQGQALSHVNKKIELYGKIKGRFSEVFGFGSGLSFSAFENLYFYTDTLRFDVTPDTSGTDVLNLFGELSLNLEDRLSLNARFDFYEYSTKMLVDAWHRPNVVYTLSGSYSISDKLLFGLNLTGLSGIKAQDPETSTRLSLDDFMDLGINIDYKIIGELHGFLQLDNILSQEYQRFLNYPNRSFMAHAGITYSFK